MVSDYYFFRNFADYNVLTTQFFVDMMKKYFVMAVALLLQFASAFAVPAHNGTVRVKQPDGSYVAIRLHGDEYLQFNATDDGYTVVKDNRGYYVYATLNADGRLSATAQVAHEAAARQADELAFLQQQPKMLHPDMSPWMAQQKETDRARRAQRLADVQAGRVNYDNFRGLILLVEFNDKPFKYANYRDLMDEMANQEDYKGNSITNVSSRTGICTGSVRDFYNDCSNGRFIPQFDVVGPIQIDYSQFDVKWKDMQDSGNSTNLIKIMADVIDAADPVVDFSQYDEDSNGVVDLVYIIFSGLGSNYEGNDSRLMWPHQADFVNPDFYNGNWSVSRYIRKDGVRMGHYACGTELYGSNDWNTLDGIGTITHEFGHVLGLPDFYDADYEKSGGESHHPGEWTVMAGGGYLNYGRTPAVYTLFERYMLGWAMPEVINSEGSYTLESIDESNTGYRLDSRVKKEYFMFENRQKTKWNKYLPGHGMLVFRVDSTNATVWSSNTVNVNPKHNYFEMVRAGGFTGSYEASSDPFPGTNRVTVLSNTTSPANLKTWAGKESPWGLKNITETNGVINFDVFDVNVLASIKLSADKIVLSTGATYQLSVECEPDNAPIDFTWSSSNNSVCTVDANGLLTALAPGTATITVSDGGERHCTASCSVTVEDMNVADNIAACKQKEEGSEVALLLDNAQVVYVNKSDIYLRDATGAIVLKGMNFSDVKKDNLLSGMIIGRFSTVDKIPQLQSVSGRTTRNTFNVTEGEPAEPRKIYTGDIRDSDFADLVTLKAVLLGSANGLSGLYAIEGGNTVRIYNTFGLKTIDTKAMASDLASRYDITGVLLTRTLNNQLIDELAMTVTPTKTIYEPFVDNSACDLNGDGMVNALDIQAVINGAVSTQYNERLDINKDGIVNALDIQKVINVAAGK